ncbi:MAG: hypothetical protein ACHP6I_03875 [Rickettsiales bacterium]
MRFEPLRVINTGFRKRRERILNVGLAAKIVEVEKERGLVKRVQVFVHKKVEENKDTIFVSAMTIAVRYALYYCAYNSLKYQINNSGLPLVSEKTAELIATASINCVAAFSSLYKYELVQVLSIVDRAFMSTVADEAVKQLIGVDDITKVILQTAVKVAIDFRYMPGNEQSAAHYLLKSVAKQAGVSMVGLCIPQIKQQLADISAVAPNFMPELFGKAVFISAEAIGITSVANTAIALVQPGLELGASFASSLVVKMFVLMNGLNDHMPAIARN